MVSDIFCYYVDLILLLFQLLGNDHTNGHKVTDFRNITGFSMEFKIPAKGKKLKQCIKIQTAEGLTFPYGSVGLQEIRLQVDIK